LINNIQRGEFLIYIVDDSFQEERGLVVEWEGCTV